MRVESVKRLIEGMPDDADIGISRTKSRRDRWIDIGVGLVGYLLAFVLIRFLFDGSMAEAVIGGWIMQLIWTRD